MKHFRPEFKIFQNADRIAERIFLALTVFFVGFIVLTSCWLVSAPKYKVKPTVFLQLFSAPSLDYAITYRDLEDVATNVLFYIPLGLFLSLAVSFRTPKFISPWLLTGFALSSAMETSQYFIGRYADPLDIVTNTAGFVLGFEMGVVAIRQFGLRPSAMLGINPDNQTSTKINTIAAVRFLYIAVYLVSSLLPFDISLDPGVIVAKADPDKYGQMRLILDPLYHWKHWRHDADSVTGLFLGLLPVGVLTALFNSFQNRLNVFSPILVCVVLVFTSELAQLFVLSRTTDIAMLPLAFAAGLGGWLAARVWFMLQDYQGYSSFDNERHRNEFLVSITKGYAVFLMAAALVPFRFEFSVRAIAQKMMYQSNWVPFANQVGMRNTEMTFWLLRDIGAFIPFGLLMTFLMRANYPILSRSYGISVVGLLSILLAFFLEVLKILGVGRYVDITSVLLALLGAIIGCVFFRFLSRSS